MRNKVFSLITALSMCLAVPAQAQFSKIARGPLSGSCGSQPSLGIDRVAGQVYSCPADPNGSYTWVGHQVSLATFNAQTAVTSVTTAQTLASLALPQGLMNVVGKTLRISGYGVYTSPGTTAPTFTIQVKIGSSVIPVAVTSAALSTSASTNMPFSFSYTVSTAAIGATGTDEAHGLLNVNISANTPAAAVTSYLDTNTAVSSTYDHTAANTLAIQVAASLTVTSVTLREATIELIN